MMFGNNTENGLNPEDREYAFWTGETWVYMSAQQFSMYCRTKTQIESIGKPKEEPITAEEVQVARIYMDEAIGSTTWDLGFGIVPDDRDDT